MKSLLLTVLIIGVSLSGCIEDLLPPPQTGNLYVLERDSDSVLSITPAGVISVLVPETYLLALIGNPGSDLSFSNCSIVTTQDTSIYFTFSSDDDGDYLIKRSPGGALSILADEDDFSAAKGGGPSEPDFTGLAWGADRMLYCLDDSSDSLMKINPSTGAVSELVSGEEFVALIPGSSFEAEPGLAADANYIYVCSDGTPDAVYRVSYDGVPEVFASGPGVDPATLVQEIISLWIEDTVTDGTFTIVIYFSGDEDPTEFILPWDTTAGAIQAAINAELADAAVVTGLGTEASPWLLTLAAGADLLFIDEFNFTGGSLYVEPIQEAGQENVVDHVEAIATDATKGSIEIAIESTFGNKGGPETVLWNVGDNALTVKSIIENQANDINPGDVAVTGTGTLAHPWVITFIGDLAKQKVDVDLDSNNTDGDVYVGTQVCANAFDDADGHITRRATGTLMMEDDSGAHFLYEITQAGVTSIFMSEWDIMIALDNGGEELGLEGGMAYDDDDNLFVGNNENDNGDDGTTAMIMRVAPNKTITEWVTAADVIAVTDGSLEDVEFEGMAFERN